MNITINSENIDKNIKISFLIIRLSSIGDIVLSTPIINAIKEQFPEAIIHFAVNKQFSKIIENNPHIDKLILYDRLINKNENNINKLHINEKNIKYDYVIDLQNNRRSKIFRKGSGKKYFSIDKRRLYKIMLTYCKKQFSDPIHCTKNYFNSIRDLLPEQVIKNNFFKQYVNVDNNIDIHNPSLTLSTLSKSLTPAELDTIESSLEILASSSSEQTVIIAPGAAHFTKRFPSSKFIELIDSIENCNIILIGGKSDIEICKIIEKSSKKRLINLCGYLELHQTAKIISQSDLIICNDSGVMHIAAGLNIPIISIFGSSVQALGFTPLSNKYYIIENNNLKCRPCSHIGRANCPKKHFKCMQDIDCENIISKINEILKK